MATYASKECTMFKPKRVIFEKDALNYPLGQSLYKQFNKAHHEVIMLSSNRVKSAIPGDDLPSQYENGKQTLVVGIKKSLKFQSCKPSAHYQLPLVSGCMGQCEYCYLNTQLGDKPFVKVHVNLDEILDAAKKYIYERLPEVTLFEGAATSDPVPVDPYTHALADCITFFAHEEHARFRFVTKYTDIDHLLSLDHKGHTQIRFSLNTDTVIHAYEHGTAMAAKRIEASQKLAMAGYPLGFIIAPVFLYPNWQEEYTQLLSSLSQKMPSHLNEPLFFEVISHRYTTKAKNRILQVFPETTLPMDNEIRQFKYGQFGYGKYIYPKETLTDLKHFFTEKITTFFPHASILYII